ncbi:hypothetical protein JIG36_47760 [Actinoplanes sp. LDG1-06]|uniref:Uncharacterized protein n=1 Tax=Paractinoplanes ovalisporus TaxID=2810368 RepID=A0ABS2ATL4_9ACTN|nr:hypothetical protein [Actinoplanes ovalisporus]MBM2623219.1 hypothetical protein [Actinoplanes ovalisporus]
MASVSYPRALAMAALQAALSGTWIAAGELSPVRRRLARAGSVVTVAAIGYIVSPPADRSAESPVSLRLVAPSAEHSLGIAAPDLDGTSPEAASPQEEQPEAEVSIDKRKALTGAVVIALSAAAIVGRRKLEKRWLTRLTRNGHAHPTRALAVRMAAVEFAGQFALQMADRRKPT